MCPCEAVLVLEMIVFSYPRLFLLSWLHFKGQCLAETEKADSEEARMVELTF